MSTGIREAIAGTLAGLSVEGITPPGGLDGQATQPTTLATWQTWPVWIGTTWATACALDHEWHVLVTLPAGDARTWNPAADALLAPVRDALEARLGHITRVEPVTVTAGDASTSMPALRFYLTTPATSL